MSAATANEPPRDVAPAPALYDRDLYAWVQEQVAALREGRLADLDLENLAEEIKDVGSEQFSKLQSSLRIILYQMLKWDHQAERRSRSWATSIRVQRLDVQDVLRINPSLRRGQQEALGAAYRRARLESATEMNRSERTLPPECPYSLDEVLNRPFDWPEE